MKKYYALGDIHGRSDILQHELSQIFMDNDTEYNDIYVILLGDVGIVYGDYQAKSLVDMMSHLPIIFIIMRGNHDKRYWKYYISDNREIEIFDKWGNSFLREIKYPNIWYVRDEGGLYDIPEIGECLFVPGASSIDKFYRLFNRLPYEYDEQLTDAEMDAVINTAKNNPIDIIFSHTCPLEWQQYFKDLLLSNIDPSQIDNTPEKFLQKLLEIVRDRYNMWYFGHYHDDRNIFDCNKIVGKMLYRIPEMLGV